MTALAVVGADGVQTAKGIEVVQDRSRRIGQVTSGRDTGILRKIVPCIDRGTLPKRSKIGNSYFDISYFRVFVILLICGCTALCLCGEYDLHEAQRI